MTTLCRFRRLWLSTIVALSFAGMSCQKEFPLQERKRVADPTLDTFEYTTVTQKATGISFEIPKAFSIATVHADDPLTVDYGFSGSSNSAQSAPVLSNEGNRRQRSRRSSRSFIRIGPCRDPEYLKRITNANDRVVTTTETLQVLSYRLEWDEPDRQTVLHIGRRKLNGSSDISVEAWRYYPYPEQPPEMVLHILKSIVALPKSDTSE